MTHIICAKLAPPYVNPFLFDLLHDKSQLAEFVETITYAIDSSDFDSDVPRDPDTIAACDTIKTLVNAYVMDQSARETFLHEDRPQDDLTQEEYEDWLGILLAIQFASGELLRRIIAEIPRELIMAALSVLPEENQARARAIFYQ